MAKCDGVLEWWLGPKMITENVFLVRTNFLTTVLCA